MLAIRSDAMPDARLQAQARLRPRARRPDDPGRDGRDRGGDNLSYMPGHLVNPLPETR